MLFRILYEMSLVDFIVERPISGRVETTNEGVRADKTLIATTQQRTNCLSNTNSYKSAALVDETGIQWISGAIEFILILLDTLYCETNDEQTEEQEEALGTNDGCDVLSIRIEEIWAEH